MIFKELDSSYAGRLHKFAQSKYPGSKLESQGPHHLRIADSPSKLKAETLGRKKHSNQKWKVHQVWGRKNIIFKCRKISSKINGTKNEFIRILREVIFSHHFLQGKYHCRLPIHEVVLTCISSQKMSTNSCNYLHCSQSQCRNHSHSLKCSFGILLGCLCWDEARMTFFYAL